MDRDRQYEWCPNCGASGEVAGAVLDDYPRSCWHCWDGRMELFTMRATSAFTEPLTDQELRELRGWAEEVQKRMMPLSWDDYISRTVLRLINTVESGAREPTRK